MDSIAYADKVREASKAVFRDYKYHLVGEGPSGWSVVVFNDKNDKKRYSVKEENGNFSFIPAVG